MSDVVTAGVLDEVRSILRGRDDVSEEIRARTDRIFADAGLDRSFGYGGPNRLEVAAEELDDPTVRAIAAEYERYVGKFDMWLERSSLRRWSPRAWDLAQDEIIYRIRTWAWPLGTQDVLRLYDWLLGTFTKEFAVLIDQYGGTPEEKDLLDASLTELVVFLQLWKPTVVAGLQATKDVARDLMTKILAKFVREALKLVVKLIIELLRMAYGVVIAALSVVIRVLKTIPYTAWLGYILGYVLSAVDLVLEATPLV